MTVKYNRSVEGREVFNCDGQGKNKGESRADSEIDVEHWGMR